MRLFTAIDLPDHVLASLERLLEALRPAARLKWSPVSNLHITTKFIGEWPQNRLDELIPVLHGLPRREPIPIAISGLGWFPNPHSPRVFWAAVKAPESLAALAKETENCLETLGIAREDRVFSPHLTLARIKDRVPLADLRETIARLPSMDFGGFGAERFHLYLSRPGSSGSIYEKLAEFPFQTP